MSTRITRTTLSAVTTMGVPNALLLFAATVSAKSRQHELGTASLSPQAKEQLYLAAMLLVGLIFIALLVWTILKVSRRIAEKKDAALDANPSASNIGASSARKGGSTVTLNRLLEAIGDHSRGGSGIATVIASACLGLVASDAVMVLIGNSPLILVLEPWFEERQYAWAASALSLACQGLVFLAGFRCLSSSTMTAIIDPGLQALASFGLGFHAEKRALILRFTLFIGCLLVLSRVVLAIPPMVPDTSKAGLVLGQALVVGMPVVSAWILTVLTLRMRVDRFIAIGFAVAVTIIVIALVAVSPGQVSAGEPPIAPSWLHLSELVIEWSVIGAMLVTVVSNPFHSRVYKLIGTDIERGDLCVDYTPFDNFDRSPRMLMFQMGRAKVLAFTRTYKATYYDAINTADDHVQVPIHDRSLKLWNITRLLTSIPSSIRTTDFSGYFAMSLTLGNLSTFAVGFGNRKRLSQAAVDLATDFIFKNDDLLGLVTRAARNALDMHVKNSKQEVDKVFHSLVNRPTALTVGMSPQQAQSNDELDAWVAQYEHFTGEARKFLKVLAENQKSFDQMHQQVANWRLFNADQQSSSENAASQGRPLTLEDAWLNQIIAQTGGASESGTDNMDYKETRDVLRATGLLFNEVTITPLGRTAECLKLLKDARVEIESQLKEYEQLYQGAIRRRTEFGHTMVGTIVSQPGMVTSRNAASLIHTLLNGNARSGKGIDPATSTLLNDKAASTEKEPDASASDDASPV